MAAHTGAATVELASGNHTVVVGAHVVFGMDVAADGTVSSLDAGKATASGNTLAFVTTSVTIDPADYDGTWSLERASAWLSGPRTLSLVPGRYYLSVGGAFFDVATDGTVSSLDSSKATASGSTLTFVTTPILIDPGTYGGTWYLGSGYESDTLSARPRPRCCSTRRRQALPWPVPTTTRP